VDDPYIDAVRRLNLAKSRTPDNAVDDGSWPDFWRQHADERARADGFGDYEEFRRNWRMKADAEARAMGYRSYEALSKARDKERRAKASEPVEFDWREDTR